MRQHLTKLMPSALALLLLCSVVANAAKPRPGHQDNKQAAHHLVTINMDIDFKPHKRSTFGRLQGYDPVEVHVHQNDRIQFVNTDDQNHTATGFSYTGQVAPAHYKFAGDYTKPHGRIIDASEWGTGNVRAHGGKSQVFVAKNVGHYFYGDGYNLGNGMIGVIVVGP
jgi:plastocyanin